MADERDDLDVAERDALRAWGADWEPPGELRESTRAELRERGLIGARAGSSRRAAFAWPAVAAAAAALAFVLGLGLGRRPEAPPAPAPTGELYMLLLYEDAAYRMPATPEDHRARVREYGDWARATAGSGRYVDGNELAPDGRWFRTGPDGLEVAAPATDLERGTLGGYFVIGARSLDDALEVTRGCPHLRHGGTVEIRKIATG